MTAAGADVESVAMRTQRRQVPGIGVSIMKPLIPPPIVMLLTGAIMWALDRWLPLGRWIVAPWNRAGLVAAALGIAIAAAAFARFRRASTTVNPMDPSKAAQLVTGGVFRVTRNPMYVGLLLLLVGWALWLGSASPWLMPPAFVLFMTQLQIIPEERALATRFGEQYAAYQRAVPRWLGPRRQPPRV